MFGEKAFTDVTKLSEVVQVDPNPAGPGTWRQTDAQWQCGMKGKAGMEAADLPAEESQQPQEPGEAPGTASLTAPEGTSPAPT